MANIRLENVTKVYRGGVRAVKDASLEIKDKEFVVFVGPSGCGKSTTLRMIAGLEDITSGNIFIGDRCVNALEPKDRNIAMVFQNYALYPHMSVYENMAYSLKCHHAKKEDIDAKVKRAASILGIEELLERTPRELSGGQRQRVALGRAIVREPDAFLFDEPLSNLDAKLRVQMRSEISKLHKDVATTFVYVTHDQTEAMTMGERIVVMKDGLIQQVDTPMNLYDHPVNVFVATFLGSPQMNIFEGKILAWNKGKYFVAEGGLEIPIEDIDLCQVEADRYPLEAYLGVRPQDVIIGDEGIETTVELVERLGEQSLIYFHLPGRKEYVIASLAGKTRLLEQDKIKVRFNTSHLHLFDKATEISLSSAIPMVKLPLGAVKISDKDKEALHSRLINQEKPVEYVFPYDEMKVAEKGEGLTLEGTIEGHKDYGERPLYFFKEAVTGNVFPLSSEKKLSKGDKIKVVVDWKAVDFLDGSGEILTSFEPISMGDVHKATLDFRPKGCFLKEAELHNHEKAYEVVNLKKLGKTALIYLKGLEAGERLVYLVEDSDLIYVSLAVYMRKKIKG